MKKSEYIRYGTVGLLLLILLAAAALLKTLPTSEPAAAAYPEVAAILKTPSLENRVHSYQQLLERVGASEAQEALFNSGLPFTGETHLLNHTSGEYIYDQYGTEGLVYCKDYFLASCYHGFVINAIARESTSALPTLMEYCYRRGEPVAIQCAHAIGHGLLAWYGYQDLPKALAGCDEIKRTDRTFPLFNCLDGAFMENLWGIHTDGTPSLDRWIKESDPFYPCSDPQILPSWQRGCWANQASVMFQLFKGSIGKVSEHCLQVANEIYKRMCFDSLARQIHPLTQGSADKTFSLCRQVDPQWQDFCINTIVSADFSVGGRTLPYELCGAVEKDKKDACYGRLYDAITFNYPAQQRGTYCSNITDDLYRNRCASRQPL